jgi:hypothetical protein
MIRQVPLLLAMLLANSYGALWAAPLPSLNGPVPSPVLYVRFVAPPTMRVQFYPGGGQAKTFGAPVLAGLRPGYIYRVQLSGFPGQPGLALYPSLEVRGTLQLPKATRPSDHPVPLNFTPEDVDRALQGDLITKVIVLEHPDQAIPEVSTPNLPLEIDGGRDPLAEARVRGRPVLIIRLGGRDMPVEDLRRSSATRYRRHRAPARRPDAAAAGRAAVHAVGLLSDD